MMPKLAVGTSALVVVLFISSCMSCLDKADLSDADSQLIKPNQETQISEGEEHLSNNAAGDISLQGDSAMTPEFRIYPGYYLGEPVYLFNFESGIFDLFNGDQKILSFRQAVSIDEAVRNSQRIIA